MKLSGFPVLLLLACPWLAAGIEPEPTQPSLAHVRRIYIEPLGGGETSGQMRDMIIAALQNSKLFVITDNLERADAILRGSSDDKIFTDEHSSSDSIGLHATSGGGSSSNNATGIGTSSHQNSGSGITDREASHSNERGPGRCGGQDRPPAGGRYAEGARGGPVKLHKRRCGHRRSRTSHLTLDKA